MRGLKVAVLVVLVGALLVACLPHGGEAVYTRLFVGATVNGKDVSYEFGEERITAVLLDSGEAEFSIFLSVKNTGGENVTGFSLIIELTDILNLSVVNLSAPLYNYTLEFRRYDTVIYVETLIPPGEAGNFSFSFTTGQVVLVLYSYFQFLFSEKLEVGVGKFVFEVWLPPRCFLYSEGVTPISPEPTSNFTDGERLVFQWEYNNLPSGTYETFIVRYSTATASEPGSSVAVVPFPVPSPQGLWWVPVVVLAAVAGIVLGAVLFYRRRGGLSDVVFPLLSDAEREVLKLLSESGGVMSQKEIQSRIGYSKAKVSMTVNLLEKKGLVEKESRGRTKIVKLTGKAKL
ncbi:MAG: MarR family transcriptional regulator [Candidatus Freyarchaeota archaeon]|nr:MarR family transcriptional regulator [Candidatus Jordarchaeia archaeon]